MIACVCVRVCSGVFGYVSVCSGLFGCLGMGVRVSRMRSGCVRLCSGVSGYVRVRLDVFGSVCESIVLSMCCAKSSVLSLVLWVVCSVPDLLSSEKCYHCYVRGLLYVYTVCCQCLVLYHVMPFHGMS